MSCEELKSCPFCGGDVSFHRDEECPGCHLIECGQCRAYFDFATGADPGNDCETVDALRAAIAPMWNARATEQGEAVEALEHASAFINKLTVPQNKEQAAIQIMNATAVLQRIGTALAAAGMGLGGEA